MARRVAWFSAGAAKPDVIVYCETGSEDKDNARFLNDCQEWLGQEIVRIRNERYRDTWDVWQRQRYLSGIHGAPCTRLLKVEPRVRFQRDDDIHIFGYTADARDVQRADALCENYPELVCEFPLIQRGLTKKHCLAILMRAGIEPPRVYALGMPNANCIPCVKAQSPAYWALIRKRFPEQFARMVALSRELGVKLARMHGKRIFIDEIPEDYPATEPLAPECDFLCQLVDQELGL